MKTKNALRGFAIAVVLLSGVLAGSGQTNITQPLAAGPIYFSPGRSVDPTTMSNKLLMGYQGWFACRSDGSAPDAWIHWFHNQTPTAANANTDFLPDLSELSPGELFNSQMTYSNGMAVPYYSAAVQKTVLRHFQWMQQNQLDGVFLQRFLRDLSGSFLSLRNQVTVNVRVGAETYGRVFAIMYDVSGCSTNGNAMFNELTNDWAYLVNTQHITNSPAYLHHKGKPVVAIWGFGFNDSSHLTSPRQARAIINYFKAAGCTVMGGVPSYWRTLSGDSYTDASWTPVYLSFDVLSPWAVGRYSDNAEADTYAARVTAPDLAECISNGVDYMPVVFPGFSWHNENGGSLNQAPRNGGSFYWEQVYNVVHSGCKMMYGAMFDECDEGTAMYKLVPTPAQLPAQGSFLALNVDGYNLPSDWYLQLANQAGRMLRGQIPLQSTLPISSGTYMVNDDTNVTSAQSNTPLVEEWHTNTVTSPALPDLFLTNNFPSGTNVPVIVLTNAPWMGSNTLTNVYLTNMFFPTVTNVGPYYPPPPKKPWWRRFWDWL